MIGWPPRSIALTFILTRRVSMRMVSTPAMAGLVSIVPDDGSVRVSLFRMIGVRGGNIGGVLPSPATVPGASRGFDSGKDAASSSAIVLSPLELMEPEFPEPLVLFDPCRGFPLA